MTRPCVLVGTVALVAALATPAQATPILGQSEITGQIFFTESPAYWGVPTESGLPTVSGAAAGLGAEPETAAASETSAMPDALPPVILPAFEIVAGAVLDELTAPEAEVALATTDDASAAAPLATVLAVEGGEDAIAAADEPSTLLMLGSGLVMVVMAMRRQAVRR